VKLLVDTGYAGYFPFEWEKIWHLFKPDHEERVKSLLDGLSQIICQRL